MLGALSNLTGYRGAIVVKVRYAKTLTPPDPGFFGRAAGRFIYPPSTGHRDPTFWERVGSMLGGDDAER